MKKLIAIIALLLFICSCTTQTEYRKTYHRSYYPHYQSHYHKY